MYDTLLPAYVHVFQTVIPRNRLPRMFSMNQARYSTVIFLRGLCEFAISTTATTCQFSIENFLKNRHERSPLLPPKSLHIHRKFTEKSYTGTGSLRIRKTYGGSWLWYPLQVSLNIVSRRQQCKETLGSGYTISLTWTVHRFFESPLYFVVAIATTN